MRISARSEYACRALIELAGSYPDKQVKQLKDIARAQAIPEKYLVHILLQLKQHGLVGSVRGASGGYYLCCAPSKISLGEVIRVIDGPILPLKDSSVGKSGHSLNEGVSDFRAVWQRVSKEITEVVNGISFADILETVNKRGKDSYQI